MNPLMQLHEVKPDGKYVIGVDPASEQDNFAIVVIELHPEHQRVVYTWTTNKKDFAGRKKVGLTDSHDYYSFCARKIRNLMKIFPCVRLGIDSQGGGFTIAEGLRDLDKLKDGERPIYPIIQEKEERHRRFSWRPYSRSSKLCKLYVDI